MTIETPMMWLVWLTVGIITGLVLNRVLPAHHRIVFDLVVGALGGVLGGLLLAITGAVGAVHFNLLSTFMAVCGAVVLLGLLRWTGIGRNMLTKR